MQGAANANKVTALGSSPVSSDTVKTISRQMNQLGKLYNKKFKNSPQKITSPANMIYSNIPVYKILEHTTKDGQNHQQKVI